MVRTLLLSFMYSTGEVDISAKAIHLEMSGLPIVAGNNG